MNTLHHRRELYSPREGVRVFRTGTAIHDGIVKVVDDFFCFFPNIPKFWGGEEFSMNVKDIVLAQRIIKFQFIEPISFVKMDGHIYPLFL